MTANRVRASCPLPARRLDIRIPPVSTDLDSLELATPKDAKDYLYYYRLGNDHASKGDYPKAVHCLEKSIELRPDFVDALVNLGGCYGILKDYPKSIEVLQKVLAADPDNARALGNLAVTYDQLGDAPRAEAYRARLRATARDRGQ